MWRRLVSVWIVVVALATAALALAQAGPGPIALHPGLQSVPLAQRSVQWLDPTGSYGIDRVAAEDASLPWQIRPPVQQVRVEGALWIRFDAVVSTGEPWYLEVGSSGTDRVQLFWRDREGQWVRREAGDRMPVAVWPLPGRVPTFALAPQQGETVRYWVKVEHNRLDFAARLTLLREPAMLVAREREQFLLGGYFGIACLMALAALANGALYRDRAFLAYAGYVVVLAAGQLARLGIGAQHLWPDLQAWNEMLGDVLPGVTAAAAVWFVRVVAQPARWSRALDLSVWALIAGTLAAVATDAVVATRTSFLVVVLCALLSLAAVVVMLVGAWRDGSDREIPLIALGFLPVVVFALFPVARGLNLIPVSTLTRYGLMFGAVLEMPILYYALSLRSQRRRESQLRAGALSHTDALTGLTHRSGMLRQLDACLARARQQKHGCALLGVRIANMEPVVEEFGREAADKALVVAASHLRRAITDRDMAARVGPHDFALLLDGPVDTTTATSRAQQVVASGLRQTDALPAALTLKFHVAVALLPQNALDAEATLAWVMESLDQMPPDSRKMIRVL